MKSALCLLILLALAGSAAAEITFTVNQSEFFFKVGEESSILVQSNNTYGKPIDGIMGYTLQQDMNQPGMMYSSTSSNSQSFIVPAGQNTIQMGFGTSLSPSVFTISISFDHIEGGQKKISLDSIVLHFVEDPSQQNTQSSQQKSSQETNSNQGSQQTNSNQGSQPSASQSQAQQSMQNLQNNQLSQDSNALKQEIHDQLQEEQEMQQAFQEELSKNQEFQEKHQELLNQGYNLTGGSLDPKSNNTGGFKLDYQSPSGDKASLRGEMKDGQMQQMQMQSPELEKQLMEILKQNPDFQEYEGQLKSQGFSLNSTQFTFKDNMTHAELGYNDLDNKTAQIIATIVDGRVKDVKLRTQKDRRWHWLAFSLFCLAVAGILLYLKAARKKAATIPQVRITRPIDYRLEAIGMLKAAKKLYADKKLKDAYGMSARAIRFYLIHKHGLGKELTNDEMICILRKKDMEFSTIKECLDMCSLVEFAKYSADDKDFGKIISQAEDILKSP